MQTKRFLFIMILATFSGCFTDKKADEDIIVIDEKTSEANQIAYALGVQYTKGLTELQLTKSQQKHFIKGIADHFGQSTQLPNNTIQALAHKVDAIRDQKRQESSLQEFKSGQIQSEKILIEEQGFQKLDNGIIYKVIKAGDVISNIATTSFIGMKYESSKLNGDIYESTLTGNPRNLPFKGIFKAWQEAFRIAGAEGEIIIIAPPKFTYGNNGAMPYVKPGEWLKFRIQFYKYYETNPRG